MTARTALVVGGGQAGLSSAIHLSLLGLDVSLIEQRPELGGKAAGLVEQGFHLDPGPSIIISPWIYADVFRKCGTTIEDRLPMQRLPQIFRIHREDGREPLDLPASRREFLDCIPEDTQGLDRLFSQIDTVYDHLKETIFERPYDRPWQLMDPGLIATALPFDVRLSYKELVNTYVRSPEMRALFYGFPSYSGQTFHSKAAGALMVPYLMAEEGVWFPEGGVAAIPDSFARLAREQGVSILTGIEAREVRSEGRKLMAIVDQNGGEHQADIIVFAMDRLTVEERLLKREVKKTPSYSYFTLHFGLNRPLEGLAHHSLLLPSDFEAGFHDLYDDLLPPRSPVVYLNSTPAPDGCSNLFVVLTVPAMHPHFDWAEEAPRQRELALRMMDKFGWPIRPEDIIFERQQSPITFLERDGSWKGSLYGPLGAERLFGLFPLSNEDPVLKNVFYAGGAVQPGAGLPMATLSGKFVADKAARRFEI